MKKLKLLVILLLSLSLSHCSNDSGDGDDSNINNVSPSDPDVLASVLVIPNAEVINSPDMPASSDPAVAPAVSHIDTNISYSAGTQMYIPCNVASPTQNNIAGVYIQVEGASTYFDVPIDAGTSNAVISVPVDLPLLVGPGNFTLILKFYDTAGNISLITEIHITVTAPSNCGTTKVSGGEGLTSNIFTIPEDAEGVITLSYNTFVVPDKVDVYQNGVWIGGTGPSTARSTLRRALNCNVATEAAGYKGEQGEFVFTYDPSGGNTIEVVMSGCEDGGTAWEYTFSCPEIPEPSTGIFYIDGVAYPSTIRTYAANGCPGGIVVELELVDSFDNVTIWNMPPASSGTFETINVDPQDDVPCNLIIAGLGDDFIIFSNPTAHGTVTKTGSNSFTFEHTWTDIDDIEHTVTGSGTY